MKYTSTIIITEEDGVIDVNLAFSPIFKRADGIATQLVALELMKVINRMINDGEEPDDIEIDEG